MKAGDRLSLDLFRRLLEEEYAKLRAAPDHIVYDESKDTTLPIAREVVAARVISEVKAPWLVDLFNLNPNNHDLDEATRRIDLYLNALSEDGRRITRNLDFEEQDLAAVET